MNPSEEFRKQLRAGNLADALTLALGETIELNITTWVSTPNEPNYSKNPSPSEPAPGHCMKTRIDLIQGDIENEIGSLFIGEGPYTELRDFHFQQVQEGRQIIQQNLESIKQMFSILGTSLSRMPKSNTVGNTVSNNDRILTSG